jgi:hypothetical protein
MFWTGLCVAAFHSIEEAALEEEKTMEIKAFLNLQDILERGDRNLKVASGEDAQKLPPSPPPRASSVAAGSPTAYGEGIYRPQAQRSARDERPFQGNDEQGEMAQERAGDVGGTDDNFKKFGEKPEGQPKPAWPVMTQAAYHGLAGEVVRTIEPHSEADPNGILIQFLAAFGNAIGEDPYYQVEGDKHRAKIFVVTSGVTAKGRKGTALGRVRQVMSIAAPEWERNNIQSGLSSGEGVIFHVRDPVTRLNNEGTIEEVDEGVADKRLMLVTEEFVSALSVMERAGNTLSPVLRDAWGTTKLQTLTRHSPLKATHSHISIIGHVTDDELRSALTRTEMAERLRESLLIHEGPALETTPTWR